MFTRTHSVAGAIAGLAMAVLSTTAEAQMPMGSQQASLTPGIVESFIASYPEVSQTAEGLSEQYDVDGDGDPMAGWEAWLAVAGAQGALNQACQSYGFENFSEWVQVLISVATAYAFASEGGDQGSQMADSIAEIQNNPDLSVAQKQMLIQQMQAMMGMFNSMMPPQENLDAVAPYADQLAVLFDDA